MTRACLDRRGESKVVLLHSNNETTTAAATVAAPGEFFLLPHQK